MTSAGEDKDTLEYASSCVIPTTWQKHQLTNVVPYNHDTSIFEFGLESGQSLSLPVCGCLLMANVPSSEDEAEQIRP
jgi:hypothetical protein